MNVLKFFRHAKCAIFFISLQAIAFLIAIAFELHFNVSLEVYWSVGLLIVPTLLIVMFSLTRQHQIWDEFDYLIFKVTFSFVHLLALLLFVKYVHPTYLPNYETMLIPFENFYIFGSAFLQYLTIELALFVAHELGYIGKKDALLNESQVKLRSRY